MRVDQSAWLLIIVVIIAIGLDLGLILFLRYARARRPDSSLKPKNGIFVFGSFSPILTWLRDSLFEPKSRRGEAPPPQPLLPLSQQTDTLPAPPAQDFPLPTAPQPADESSEAQVPERETPEQPELQFISLATLYQSAKRFILRPVFAGTPAIEAKTGFNLTILLEWGLIFVLVIVYCSGFLGFKWNERLPGNESEVFQYLDWVFYNSVTQDHHLPLWNPNIYSGVPLVADPMFSNFSPLVALPTLAFGVRNGFKIAVLLSFLIGALGMWWFGKVLGMKPPARLWLAAFFTFAGQPTAHFFQGQYLFIFAWAWIPWIFSSLIMLLRTRRKLFAGIGAFSLALIFLSGNVYYAYYTLLVIGIFCLVYWIDLRRQKPHLRIEAWRVRILVLTGLVGLGLIAVQLLPMAQLWPKLQKAIDLTGSQTIQQAFLDFLSKDSNRPDAYSVFPAREEFYAYIGVWPFLLLLGLPLALKKKNRRTLIFMGAVFVYSLIWIDLKDMPWASLYLKISFLGQFRHPIRMIIFAEIALLTTAALSLDGLWRSVSAKLNRFQELPTRGPGYYGWQTLRFLILIFLAASTFDLFSTNQAIVGTWQTDQLKYAPLQWLKNYDPGVYYIRINPNNSGYEAMITQSMRPLEVWYHYNNILSPDPNNTERSIEARPNYILQITRNPVDYPDAVTIYKDKDYSIYRLTNSLPFAFSVPDGSLLPEFNSDQLLKEEVTPITAYTPNTDQIQMIANSVERDRLIVLATYYPGWTVHIDGKPALLKNTDGYLSVEMPRGTHLYTFKYQSIPFKAGLPISLICLGIALYWVFSDWQPEVARVRYQIERAVQRIPWKKAGKRAAVPGTPSIPRIRLRNITWSKSLAGVLFFLSGGIYLVTRFWGLDRFPIYFFTDEAIQTMSAVDLIRDGFRDPLAHLLPTFFQNGGQYNLSVSVYLQVIPYLLFGKSIWITRGISVLITLIAAVAVGLTLKNIYKSPYYWVATLLLSITPAWFLHSRTAFETVLMVSFYAGFLYFYLLYRSHSPKYLYAALICGGLAFYSYSPGQIVVVLTGFLFLLSDWRYHWENRKTTLVGAMLLGLMVLPYLRFLVQMPGENERHLQILSSYWIRPISFVQKLQMYFSQYLYGLSPSYWFIPNNHDLARHLMKGYGHILLATLPFALLGLGIALKNFRNPIYRIPVFAWLVAPAGAALVEIGITRTLVMVIPITLLTALGVSACLTWLERFKISRIFLALLVFVGLGGVSIHFLNDALVNGPTWYKDYGLGGMQYGAHQVFTAATEYQRDYPETHVLISPSWANGTDALERFFIPDGLDIHLESIDSYTSVYTPFDQNTVFVMIPEEYERVKKSQKFTDIQVLQILPYPDGSPGFYFVKLRYVDNIQAILEEEKIARRQLQSETLTLDGQSVAVKYSPLDMGNINNMFDGDADNSLARTMEANPMVVDLTFPSPRKLSGVNVQVGSAATQVKAILTIEGQNEPVSFEAWLNHTPINKQVIVNFGGEQAVTHLRLEITSTEEGEPAHVHVWEIILK